MAKKKAKKQKRAAAKKRRSKTAKKKGTKPARKKTKRQKQKAKPVDPVPPRGDIGEMHSPPVVESEPIFDEDTGTFEDQQDDEAYEDEYTENYE